MESYIPTIDPSRYRFRNAFTSLTVVRLIRFILRVLGRALLFVARLLLDILKTVGLFFIDIVYGIKLRLVEVRYSGKREQLQVNFFAAFISLLIRQIVAAGINLFRRSGRLTVESVQRGRQGIAEETKRYEQRSIRVSPRSRLWSTINFAVILFVLMLPFLGYAQWRRIDPLRQRVLTATSTAFSSLFSAKDFLSAREIPEARQAFAEAGQNFLLARQELSSINGFLLSAAAIVPNDDFQLAAASKHLLKAGELSSRLGEQLSSAMTLPAGMETSTVNYLDNFISVSDTAVSTARELEEELSAVDPSVLPEAYRGQFSVLASKASFLTNSLSEASTLARELETLLGKKMDRRYMLVFQNNSEKRASGGFIGSFAIVDVRKGEIKSITVPKGGSYDTEAGLTRLVAAPEPLRLLNPLWHFWDANWWPDWPTSARNLMRFYEESNGPTVDGVISLTPTVMERLLEVIGPIDMTAEYGVVISAENFWTVTQTFSEQKPDKTKEPKKIIGDLMDRIVVEAPKRLDPEKTIKLIAMLESSLNEKQILAYMSDTSLQKTVDRFGWSGRVAQTKGDYLMVVDSNIGGQKSDRVITETITHRAQILPDGSIIDTLTVRRAHSGEKQVLFTGARNVNWMRIYVPENSTLISASGFSDIDPMLFEEPQPGWERSDFLKAESSAVTDPVTGIKIYSEQGKTVFADWLIVDPGQTVEVTLTYRLPFTLPLPKENPGLYERVKAYLFSQPIDTYSLLVQKQPGAERIELNSTLNGLSARPLVWKYPPTLESSSDGWTLTKPLDTDFFAAVLLKH